MDGASLADLVRHGNSGVLAVDPAGDGRYRIHTGFRFDDGDHLSVVLQELDGEWVFTDDANTYMRLSYDLAPHDLQEGTRQRVIYNALTAYDVQDREGRLVKPIDAPLACSQLAEFVQAVLRIYDVRLLSRERVRSSFMGDLHVLLRSTVPAELATFHWHDQTHDPAGKYPVDCRIGHPTRPLIVCGLPSNDAVRDMHATLLQYKLWGLRFLSIAVFEDQTEIQRAVLARFSDVVDKQFSTLNRDTIQPYLEEQLAHAA